MIVIFDPEGVLVDTESCRFGSWERMALEQGIVLDKSFFNQFHGASDDKICLDLWKQACGFCVIVF